MTRWFDLGKDEEIEDAAKLRDGYLVQLQVKATGDLYILLCTGFTPKGPNYELSICFTDNCSKMSKPYVHTSTSPFTICKRDIELSFDRRKDCLYRVLWRFNCQYCRWLYDEDAYATSKGMKSGWALRKEEGTLTDFDKEVMDNFTMVRLYDV